MPEPEAGPYSPSAAEADGSRDTSSVSLGRDYVDYRRAMTRLFAEVDPWGYICENGAPDDEYESHISTLLKWGTPVTVERVAEVLGPIDLATAQRPADGHRSDQTRAWLRQRLKPHAQRHESASGSHYERSRE